MTPWKPAVLLALLLAALAPTGAGITLDICYEVQHPLDPPYVGPCQTRPIASCRIDPASCSVNVNRPRDECVGLSSKDLAVRVGNDGYWCVGAHLASGSPDCVGRYARDDGHSTCTLSLP